MAAPALPAPVFVDDSGRRHRLVRAVGWIVGGLMVAYLALLTVSLVGGPGLLPVSLPAIGRLLPGPQAAGVAATARNQQPGQDTAPPAPATSATGSAGGQQGATAGAGGRDAPSTVVPATSPTSAHAHPTPRPSARPTPAPSASPKGTTPPGQSKTPTPHATSHPSPTHTSHGHKASPTPTTTP